MKKIVLLCFGLLMYSCNCLAAGTSISVIADMPALLKNDKAIINEIDIGVRKIFKSHKFEIKPTIEESLLLVRQYRLDNGLINKNGSGDFLKSRDVQNLGKMFKTDYVFHIEAFPQALRGKASLFSARVKYSAICNLKVMNIRTGEFVIIKQLIEEGDTGTSYGKMAKHFAEFIPRSLNDAKLDVSKL